MFHTTSNSFRNTGHAIHITTREIRVSHYLSLGKNRWPSLNLPTYPKNHKNPLHSSGEICTTTPRRPVPNDDFAWFFGRQLNNLIPPYFLARTFHTPIFLLAKAWEPIHNFLNSVPVIYPKIVLRKLLVCSASIYIGSYKLTQHNYSRSWV